MLVLISYERYARNVETKSSGYWVVFIWGSKEAAKGSTRSFTVVVKFDAQKKVREFAPRRDLLTMALRAAVAVVLAGCVQVSKPAAVAVFAVPPAAAAQRVMQSRRYETRDEMQVLRASGALLMDLGFTVDRSDESVGVLVASKDRGAVEVGQVVLSFFLAALAGTDVPYDHHQKLRASVVTHPSGKKSVVVRVTFQRIVWDTHGNISRREQMNKPEYYQEFFEKLSKSLLLEAQDA